MTAPRFIVVAGISSAAVFWVCWIYFGLIYLSKPEVPDDVASRLAYALTWEVFVGLMLLIGVAANAHQRFTSDELIDGSKPDQGTFQDINSRYLQNTQEQALLALIAHLSLAIVVPISSLHIIPVLAVLFVVARFCFWVGYHISPPARAFGFASTFHPTVAAFLYVIWSFINADA